MTAKHALITGGGRGIGLAIARRLGKQYRVTILGRDETNLAMALDDIKASGAKEVHFESADVTNDEATVSAFERARTQFGPISILINNVGAASSNPLISNTEDEFRSALEINLVQVHRCMRLSVPDMIAEGWGRVVNIASTAGVVGYPYVSSYCSAKHGVIGLTRAMALELVRKGITINAVCPTYTNTELLSRQIHSLALATGAPHDDLRRKLISSIPLGRLIEPDEIAAAVEFLCQIQAAAVTGQAIVLAGGEYAAG